MRRAETRREWGKREESALGGERGADEREGCAHGDRAVLGLGRERRREGERVERCEDRREGVV